MHDLFNYTTMVFSSRGAGAYNLYAGMNFFIQVYFLEVNMHNIALHVVDLLFFYNYSNLFRSVYQKGQREILLAQHFPLIALYIERTVFLAFRIDVHRNHTIAAGAARSILAKFTARKYRDFMFLFAHYNSFTLIF